MTGLLSVLLADDQVLLREALSTVLGADPRIEVVGGVDDGAAVVTFVQSHRVDVILMDVRMPGMDGIAATAEVLKVSPRTRILILTTFDLDEYVFAAIQAGASGFLTKDARPVSQTHVGHSPCLTLLALGPLLTPATWGYAMPRRAENT